uniref:hypothetical protein n=1 Tax=Acetatifactor sp. TaxID=1872090 RepID=UPI004057A619
MKTRKLICILLCGIILLGLKTLHVEAAEKLNQDCISISFEYPIRAGMEEWKNLNHGERVLASQIPEDVLMNMTTEELVEAVIDYPCFIDMIFYDTYQEGFEAVLEHFNGLQELLKREDAGSYLLTRYSNENLLMTLNSNNDSEKFYDLLDVIYIETLLAQPEIAEDLTEEEMLDLAELVEDNYGLQLENAEKSVIPITSAYYQVLAEQQNVEPLYTTSTVKTPNGSTVSVIIRTEWDTYYEDRETYKAAIEEEYPGANVVDHATLKYNCHAYAWASSTSVWMNDPSKYWTDGSYTLKSSDDPTAIGQKAYYPGNGNEHSGVVISLTGNEIRSKWAEYSLVEHSVENCPYFFIPLSVKFYGR